MQHARDRVLLRSAGSQQIGPSHGLGFDMDIYIFTFSLLAITLTFRLSVSRCVAWRTSLSSQGRRIWPELSTLSRAISTITSEIHLTMWTGSIVDDVDGCRLKGIDGRQVWVSQGGRVLSSQAKPYSYRETVRDRTVNAARGGWSTLGRKSGRKPVSVGGTNTMKKVEISSELGTETVAS